MNNNSNTTVLAFLLGAATGGIAALLLAPTSGKNLRDRVGEQAGKAGAEAARLADEARAAAVGGYREAARRTEDVVDNTKAKAKAGKKAVLEAVAEGKASYARDMGSSN